MADPVRRRAWIFAGAGAAVWALLWIAPLGSDVLPIPRLLMLAMLVVTPLGIALTATPARDGGHSHLYVIIHWAQPFAALLAAASFYLPAGIVAALLAGPWLLLCMGVGLFGLLRAIPRGFYGAAETCIDAGLVYLPVGALWLFLSRLGLHPMGFDGTITALTAIHFHYAGFAAPIFGGMVGRQLGAMRSRFRTVFAIASAGVKGGIALVAVGITFSPGIEVGAALILAVSLGTVALLALTTTPALPVASRLLIAIAALALIGGMVLAGVYAVGEFTGAGWLVIPQMVQYHGIANATGVVLGLVGWGIAATGTAAARPRTA